MSGNSDARRRPNTSPLESFRGCWRIVWMSGWDQDYVDMEVPGHFTFASGRSGSFQFGLHRSPDTRAVRPEALATEFLVVLD